MRVHGKVTAKISTSYRIPPAIYEQINRLAEETGQTKNGIVVQALEDFFLCLESESAIKEEKK